MTIQRLSGPRNTKKQQRQNWKKENQKQPWQFSCTTAAAYFAVFMGHMHGPQACSWAKCLLIGHPNRIEHRVWGHYVLSRIRLLGNERLKKGISKSLQRISRITKFLRNLIFTEVVVPSGVTRGLKQGGTNFVEGGPQATVWECYT